MLTARRNKVYANIGVRSTATSRIFTVLDTGAVSSFIRRSLIPKEHIDKIRPLPRDVKVRDTNKKPLALAWQIILHVRLNDHTETVIFYIAERLAAPALLSCDFCEKHVESIRPRMRIVELEDGSSVSIVRAPRTRTATDKPLPHEQ